jgi:DNA-binding transcriptional regulator YbjK
MKLNQLELKTMCKRIVRDLQDQADAEQRCLDKESDKKNEAAAKKIFTELTQANKNAYQLLKDMRKATKKFADTGNTSYGINREKFHFGKPDLKNILHSMRTKQTAVVVPFFSDYNYKDSDIFQDLVLAQIEHDDISKLRDAVQSKYQIKGRTGLIES